MNHRGKSRVRLLETDLLYVFVTVVLCGGFTAAAQILNRTQAAVSLQIKRLEEVVGAPLLVRSSRKVELTAKGETLLGYAERMLAINEEAMLQLHLDTVAGPVRVGSFHHFANVDLPPILSRFTNEYPHVWVEVHVGLQTPMTARLGSEYDVVIGLAETPPADAIVIRHEQVGWFTSRSHAQHLREPVPLALLPKGALFRRWAIEGLSGTNRAWRIAQVSSDAPSLEAAVASGNAVAVFKERTPRSPEVRRLSPEEGFPTLPDVCIFIEVMTGASAAARRFAEFVIDELRDQ